MKKIRVQFTPEHSLSSIIETLDNKIPESTKKSNNFQPLYEHTIEIIKDFHSKAQKIMKAGTSIHLEKEIQLPRCKVHILLDTSYRKSFGEKLRGLLR